jgi:uncharacterized protein
MLRVSCFIQVDCPNHHKEPLQQALFHHVEVDYCPECLGVWFDKDELAHAKDDKDEQLKWLDFDIWRDKSKFTIQNNLKKRCPVCRIPFTEVHYDNSKVKVDFCKHCQGIWLDRGEFKQIIIYLIRKYDYEMLHHYVKNLAIQLWEVFSGPAKFREELEDFLMLVKLFQYKFVAQHPHLEALIKELPK